MDNNVKIPGKSLTFRPLNGARVARVMGFLPASIL